MTIQTLINKLDGRLRIARRYANVENYDFPNDLIGYATSIRSKDGFVGSEPILDGDTYVTTDMAVVGQGDQKRLADEWSFRLPADYVEFCSRFDEYVVAGSSMVAISNAKDVRESVIAAREAVDIDGLPDHYLFHFAQVIGMPAYYAFRWTVDRKKMDVVYVWNHGDVSQIDLLGEHRDHFVCANDFTSWLATMIETDGNPLYPGEIGWPTADGSWYEDEYPYFQRMA